jgi:UDP-2,3-diacylglucosamine pyrophosphatase LpxH
MPKDMTKVKTYSSVFLSDTHLGWSRSNCGDAALFLDSVKCDKLYLNGDIFDGWKLRRRWFWAEDHDLFLSAILRKIDEGTKVTLLPGNHDETLRNPTLRGIIKKISLKYNFNFASEARHKTVNGQIFKVMHGDQFDDSFTRSVSEGADRLYNGTLEKIRKLGRPSKVKKKSPFSLARYFRKVAKGGGTSLKSNNETFIKYIFNKLAQKPFEYDGLIIGHTHMPLIESVKVKESSKKAFTYANSGDWVENMTALVETKKGEFKLIEAEDALPLRYFEDHAKLKASGALKIHPKADDLRRWLHRLWSPTLLDKGSYTGTSKQQRKQRKNKIFN